SQNRGTTSSTAGRILEPSRLSIPSACRTQQPRFTTYGEGKRGIHRSPRLPPDLETVCLKGLQKNPEAPCPSAASLADDLQRRLAAAPLARRLGLAITSRFRPATPGCRRRSPASVSPPVLPRGSSPARRSPCSTGPAPCRSWPRRSTSPAST